MIDVREVKLNLRYPESRQEDITDAFMRGYTNAVEIGNYEIYSDMRDIVDEMEAENAKLRELCADLYAEMIEYSDAPHYNASVWAPKLRELGIEVL